jgi:diaminohydroxyphosphoribosylaminopyrimidine deaminase / 5-amino-6-(5-phosphoribosylamino)uracil reductase
MYSGKLTLNQIIENPMALALSLAKYGQYTASPNPMVGAVILKDNRLVGYGYHLFRGDDHAESKAIDMAGADNTKDAVLYLNLEPCAHQGLTPPCVDKVIAAGISEVHISSIDPNPLTKGRSIAKLEASGIKVIIGELAMEAEQLNEIFYYYMKNNLPYVIAKWAMTMDGRMGTSKDSKWITGEEAREHVHRLRNSVDAILIGSNTAIKDNPSLNVRVDDLAKIRQPLKFVLGKSLDKLPLNCNLFTINPEKTYLVNSSANKATLEKLGVNFIEAENLHDLLEQMANLPITSLLVEGGGHTLSKFLEGNIINKFYCYMAAKFIGGSKSILPFSEDIGVNFMRDAKQAKFSNIEFLGDDILIQGRF